MKNPEQPSEKPLISVITVCLNAAEFIEQTILSVLSQTYPHVEYIVLDGGSTDGTVEIIRRYESRLAYWHSWPDRGQTHAFNLGLALALGDWLLYLNADDFLWEPSVVEKMAPYLFSHKEADVVFGQTITVTRQQDSRPAPMRKVLGHPWRWQEFRWQDTIPHPSVFTNRQYFDRVGGFDETYRIAMDYEIYLRGGKTLQVHYLPIPVTGMREGGVSRENVVRTFREGRRALDKNQALPLALCWLNFFWRIGYYYLGQAAHKVLDPLAQKIAWPGRNTGRFL
ncbi:MAG: glycosyltransferase family 2 protein [Desulfobaccales bacterium]|nr:glycosyltransferase family 2 protein [Desulfobaccales bacterium]